MKRVLVLVIAALFLLVGAGFTLGAWLQGSEGGYFSSGAGRVVTSTAALKTDEIEVGETSAHAADPDPDVGELARVKIAVRHKDPRVPIFVGIGPKRDVEEFLRGTAYDDFASATFTPFRPRFERQAGEQAAGDPRSQAFWVARSAGTGLRVVEWDKTHGPWSAVVIRLDGRAGLDVQASIGLRFGFLLPIGLGVLLFGAILLGIGIRLRARSAE